MKNTQCHSLVFWITAEGALRVLNRDGTVHRIIHQNMIHPYTALRSCCCPKESSALSFSSSMYSQTLVLPLHSAFNRSCPSRPIIHSLSCLAISCKALAIPLHSIQRLVNHLRMRCCIRPLAVNLQPPPPHLLIHLLQTRDDGLEQRLGEDWRNSVANLLAQRVLSS